MNEDGIRLLSTALWVLLFLSIAAALLVVLASRRARQERRAKDETTPRSRLTDPGDMDRRN